LLAGALRFGTEGLVWGNLVGEAANDGLDYLGDHDIPTTTASTTTTSTTTAATTTAATTTAATT
jgi:hypothetical protein